MEKSLESTGHGFRLSMLPSNLGNPVGHLPEPADHDVCFAAAGFHGLADTDAQWDGMDVDDRHPIYMPVQAGNPYCYPALHPR